MLGMGTSAVATDARNCWVGALRLDEGARRLSRNRGRGGEGGRMSVVAKGSGVLGPRVALRDPRVLGAMRDCKGGIAAVGVEVCEHGERWKGRRGSAKCTMPRQLSQ